MPSPRGNLTVSLGPQEERDDPYVLLCSERSETPDTVVKRTLGSPRASLACPVRAGPRFTVGMPHSGQGGPVSGRARTFSRVPVPLNQYTPWQCGDLQQASATFFPFAFGRRSRIAPWQTGHFVSCRAFRCLAFFGLSVMKPHTSVPVVQTRNVPYTPARSMRKPPARPSAAHCGQSSAPAGRAAALLVCTLLLVADGSIAVPAICA